MENKDLIRALEISTNEEEEKRLIAEDFTKIDVNLDQSLHSSVFLWFKKKGPNPPITRMQLSCNDEMAECLERAGYTCTPKSTKISLNGKLIYLWYHSDAKQLDTAIEEVNVTKDVLSEANLFRDGWEKLQCDVNYIVGGPWIHIWGKRSMQTRITDVTACFPSLAQEKFNLQKGYVRLDDNVNRDAGGTPVFLWYLPSTSGKPITHLKVSINQEECDEYKKLGYTKVDVNLNEEVPTAPKPKYLWKKSSSDGLDEGIRIITVVDNPDSLLPFKNAGVTIIEGNINPPLPSPPRPFVYLGYK